MSQALALGADRDWTNEQFSTPIHQSILSGSVMACEFLLLNGAKINAIDASGKLWNFIKSRSKEKLEVWDQKAIRGLSTK